MIDGIDGVFSFNQVMKILLFLIISKKQKPRVYENTQMFKCKNSIQYIIVFE